MFSSSRLEISQSALVSNLAFIRSIIGEGVILSSVVKGNAYGHSIEAFVPLAENCGINHFSVFSADEAYRLNKVSNGKSAIMIMGMMGKGAMEWAILNTVSFFVFDLNRLALAAETALRLGKAAKVHIELETGMNRTGFAENELEAVADLLKKYPKALVFEGLCTHYAGAESIANYYRVEQQKKNFKLLSKKLKQLSQRRPKITHTACSAACIRHPETTMDLVRIGILQYGFWPSPETFIEYSNKSNMMVSPLERVISWKSEVMNIKTVKTGEFVGYGTSYLANKDIQIAVIPVGYSHGFSRGLSNQGRVLLHGQRIPVIGMVNMNAIVVDITELENVQKGDEVVIIGKQGNNVISVASFSDFSNQVNYELLTRLPEHLPRIVVA